MAEVRERLGPDADYAGVEVKWELKRSGTASSSSSTSAATVGVVFDYWYGGKATPGFSAVAPDFDLVVDRVHFAGANIVDFICCVNMDDESEYVCNRFTLLKKRPPTRAEITVKPKTPKTITTTPLIDSGDILRVDEGVEYSITCDIHDAAPYSEGVIFLVDDDVADKLVADQGRRPLLDADVNASSSQNSTSSPSPSSLSLPLPIKRGARKEKKFIDSFVVVGDFIFDYQEHSGKTLLCIASNPTMSLTALSNFVFARLVIDVLYPPSVPKMTLNEVTEYDGSSYVPVGKSFSVGCKLERPGNPVGFLCLASDVASEDDPEVGRSRHVIAANVTRRFVASRTKPMHFECRSAVRSFVDRRPSKIVDACREGDVMITDKT